MVFRLEKDLILFEQYFEYPTIVSFEKKAFFVVLSSTVCVKIAAFFPRARMLNWNALLKENWYFVSIIVLTYFSSRIWLTFYQFFLLVLY